MAITTRELLNEGTRRLSRVVADNPRLAAEYLLQAILGLKKIDLYLEPQREVAAGAEAEFWEKVGRKLDREPLQYILGETEWFGLVLKCDKRALIPRPETEIIVEHAVGLLQEISSPEVLEIGTGSGAIAIAVARTLPQAEITATDLSADALSLADENIRAHDLVERIRLHRGSLFEPLADDMKFDLVIANPPYIRTGEYPHLMPEVRDHEPAPALVAGDDGLDVIRPLVQSAHRYLKPGGWLVFEFGSDHTQPVREMAEQTGRYNSPEIIIDYNQQERGVILQCR